MREIDRIRKENEALNEQVKLLVRTEHELFRAQTARDRELSRIQALGDFALASASLADPSEILGRAMALLNQLFQFDQAVCIYDDPEHDRVSVIEKSSDDGFRSRSLESIPDGADWLRGLHETVMLEPRRSPVDPGLATLLASMHSRLSGGARCEDFGDALIVMPLRLDAKGDLFGVIMACRHEKTAASYYKVNPSPEHVPFLRLMATHLERALHNAVLKATLRERGHELEQANEQLSASLQRLERTQQQLLQARKMEAVGRLAGGIAHDFNNLLTVILSHADLARERLARGEAGSDDMDQIVEAGERAAQITSQLLAFSRRQTHRPEPVDLNALLRATSRMLGRLIGEHIHLDLRLDARIPRVDADRSQLEQVVLNLVINARDAMPEGGTVAISTRVSAPEDALEIETGATADGFVVMTVQDTGEGMDEETLGQIFEPFYTTKEVGRGTGLGLSMVYGVVKQGGGDISVKSAPGQGSCFTLFFPVAHNSVEEQSVSPCGRSSARESGRILLVEDEASIRDVAARVLEDRGYDVVSARDGLEALDRLAAGPDAIDLLITDVVMPRMGGAKLATELRADRPRLPVLYMSGYTEEAVESPGNGNGLDHYMKKPFTPEVLLDHARKAMRAAEIPAN